MTCLTCKHWQPKAAPAMTKQGFAPCEKGPAHRFVPMKHTCGSWRGADDQVQAARKQWAERLQTQMQQTQQPQQASARQATKTGFCGQNGIAPRGR